MYLFLRPTEFPVLHQLLLRYSSRANSKNVQDRRSEGVIHLRLRWPAPEDEARWVTIFIWRTLTAVSARFLNDSKIRPRCDLRVGVRSQAARKSRTGHTSG